MSTTPMKPLAECETPCEALRELCAPFAGSDFSEADCAEVRAEQLPADYRRLLAHHNHMTVALQEYHESRLDLYVMEHRQDGDFYTRKIYLALPKTTDAVELGVVRLDLRCLPEAVRAETLARRTPLGAVLIRHNVHRRIEPRWFLQFPAGSGVLRWFGLPRQQGPFYGRIGTIYCNDEPAIELLEIVTLWDKQDAT